MKFRRRKNLLKGLILSFATAAIVIPTAQARVSNYNTSSQQARTALNQSYSPQSLRALSLRSEAMNELYQGQSIRPDDRTGVRGVEPAQAITDLSEVQRHVKADQIGSASVSSRPDDKAGFRGPGTVESRTAELASVKGDGFNWQDASIGAGTTIGIALVLMSGLAVMKRRHSELAV